MEAVLSLFTVDDAMRLAYCKKMQDRTGLQLPTLTISKFERRSVGKTNFENC